MCIETNNNYKTWSILWFYFITQNLRSRAVYIDVYYYLLYILYITPEQNVRYPLMFRKIVIRVPYDACSITSCRSEHTFRCIKILYWTYRIIFLGPNEFWFFTYFATDETYQLGRSVTSMSDEYLGRGLPLTFFIFPQDPM